MLDAILEIFQFLQGTSFFVFSIVSAADDVVDFFLAALPFVFDFVIDGFGESLFSTCMVICLGLGTVKFLYPGADG